MCVSIHPDYYQLTEYFLEELADIVSVEDTELVLLTTHVFGEKFVDKHVSAAGIELYGEEAWEHLLVGAEEMRVKAISEGRKVMDFLAEQFSKERGNRPTREEIMSRQRKASGSQNVQADTKNLDLFSDLSMKFSKDYRNKRKSDNVVSIPHLQLRKK